MAFLTRVGDMVPNKTYLLNSPPITIYATAKLISLIVITNFLLFFKYCYHFYFMGYQDLYNHFNFSFAVSYLQLNFFMLRP